MNNQTKTRIQQQEFAYLKNKHNVILKWATGCGKSKMSIDLVNNAISAIPTPRVLFVVAERAHIKNWQQEFKKWNLNTAAEVICYASLKKMKDATFDVLVLDEAHHAFSKNKLEILQTISASYVYLLSATLPSAKQDEIEAIFGKFTVSNITLKEAIDSDILPDPRVYVVAMELDDTIQNQEIKIGKESNPPVVSWENRMKYIINHKSCVIKCTEKQKYIYFTETMDYWKRRYEHSKNQMHHNWWVNTGSQRKRFIGELKTPVVKQLLKEVGKKKTVCFCSSVAQANSLSSRYTISSKKPMKYNQAVIDDFNKGTIRRIFAVGMITEGMNLADIETGIIVQLDGKERLFIQKFGRSLRAKNPESYIFYYKGTQDENYLKNALQFVDAKFVRHIDINQLTTIKASKA